MIELSVSELLKLAFVENVDAGVFKLTVFL